MLKFYRLASFLAISSVGLFAQVSAESSAGSRVAPAGQPVFKVVATPSPNQPSPANNYLRSISASSPTDIWAVGASVIHFDGQQWTGFSAPDMSGNGSNLLNGVADLSPGDVWAVGYINFGVPYTYQAPIIEHFEGGEWTIFPSPQFPKPDEASLAAIVAISPTNIWAGGDLFADPYSIPLIEHFNGTSWTQVEAPDSDCGVLGMSAEASDDVWAVGATLGGGGTCTLHYDGSAWQYLPSPNPGFGFNFLQGVAALAPNNVWAAGWYTEQPDSDRPELTLIEHWDGTNWQIVPSPNVGMKGQVSNRLNGIVAVSAGDLWAFGQSSVIATSVGRNLALHWNGARWQIVSTPDVKLKNLLNDDLLGGLVIPDGGLWIAGSDNVFDTLVLMAERY
ncbi:MAG: hypothetical protein WA824_04915 [Candidatus Sulfotelmatobacter sp.]